MSVPGVKITLEPCLKIVYTNFIHNRMKIYDTIIRCADLMSSHSSGFYTGRGNQNEPKVYVCV